MRSIEPRMCNCTSGNLEIPGSRQRAPRNDGGYAFADGLSPTRAMLTYDLALEAAPVVHVADTALAQVLRSVNMADICITSGFQLLEGGGDVIVEKAAGSKCERCWKYTTDVGTVAQHSTVCKRCAAVVQKEQKSAAA